MPQKIIGRGWAFPLQVNAQGSIALTHERDEIDQAIHIILSTSPGERVMRPTFGCRLQDLEVDVQQDRDAANCLVIRIQYEIKATHDRRSLVYPFYLIPEE